MLVPEALRSVCDSFGLRMRGFSRPEVRIYLGRLALAVEAFGDAADPNLEPPAYFTPAAISAQKFETVAWGYSPRQVQAFLDDLANELANHRVIDVRTNQSSHAAIER